MLAVVFDTLKLARKLESAGFPAKQAQDASAALAESFAEWQSTIDLATRADVKKVETDLRELELRLESRFRDLQLHIGGMIVALGGILIAIRYFG